MNADLLEPEQQEELRSRGYSRRQVGRIAALVGAGVALSQFSEAALAQQSAKAVVGAVRIGSNECWTGPFAEGVIAAEQNTLVGNRYEPDNDHAKLFAAVSEVEGVPTENILAWPGSSDPLSRAVVTFCSPKKALVTANPSYEQGWRTAAWLGAKLTRVPLTPDYAHDVKAMLAAEPDAGMFYICSPNNPTGTTTPLEDIKWLLEHKAKDSIVVVDEAYIHWTDKPRAAQLAASRDDMLVLRTFSKLFGMAGMRLGLTIGSPKLFERMMRYDGGQVTFMLPMPTVACGTAVLPLADKIAARKAMMIASREATFEHLKKRGIPYIPSEANMFMLDWGPGKDPKKMMAAMLEHNVQIGRSWDFYPTMNRVTVGSPEEMQKFCLALDKVLMA